jgi:hypothetical protein
MTQAEQPALDAAVRQFPFLVTGARNFGIEHPSVQQRASDQYDEIVAEYRRIIKEDHHESQN